MEFVEPSVQYKDSFIEAVKEYQADPGSNERGKSYLQLSIPELEQDFESYVEKEKSHARGENLQPGWVPATTLWLIHNGEYIGRLGIRHELNEHLLKVGGHIGYDVRPSKRMKGYGSKMLELALPYAKTLGMDRVLVTCDAHNEGSKKIIEKNGGILEDRYTDPASGADKLRYWIELKQ